MVSQFLKQNDYKLKHKDFCVKDFNTNGTRRTCSERSSGLW